MRILITTERQGAAGGIETYLRAVAPRLTAAGHDLAWLFGSPSLSSESSIDSGRDVVWHLPSSSNGEVPTAIEAWAPDVVYAHGLHQPKWDRILAERYPTAYFMHGYFGACISGRKCYSREGGLDVCTRTLGPACLALYLPLGCGGRDPIRMLSLYATERRRQRNLRRFPAVVAASHSMADECKRQGVTPERTHVLPLFPPDQIPDPVPPQPRPWTGRVLFVGRLTDIKGVAFIAGAVAEASRRLGRQLTLVVVGDGPGSRLIEQQACSEKIRLEAMGRLNPEQRNEEMRKADILLVPSLWPEPFGLVGIEAGCVGLPAVAFDVGGISDWLRPGVSGELASKSSARSQSLGAALARAMGSPDHWQKLRSGAWETARTFDPAGHIDRLTQILNDCKSNFGQF